ncbi:MAG: 30S ribosomal protein S16, partial [Planctomycetia bacterium]|nr:30S ribosomal protein S16 [Planctomycetia bacterium]
MIKIRLQRAGRRHIPLWRVVATDHRAARDGRAVEILGNYDPREINEKKLRLKVDRVKYWLHRGAQCSQTMLELIAHIGIDGRGNDITPRPWKKQKVKAKPEPKAETPPQEDAAAEEPAEEAAAEEPAEETAAEGPAEETAAE